MNNQCQNFHTQSYQGIHDNKKKKRIYYTFTPCKNLRKQLHLTTYTQATDVQGQTEIEEHSTYIYMLIDLIIIMKSTKSN